MERWNSLMNSAFMGCQILGAHPDNGRHRVIVGYAIPGDPDNIGLCDGVDAWIVPAASPAVADWRQLAKDIYDGKVQRVIEQGQTRRQAESGELLLEYGLLPKGSDYSDAKKHGATVQPDLFKRPRMRATAETPSEFIPGPDAILTKPGESLVETVKRARMVAPTEPAKKERLRAVER